MKVVAIVEGYGDVSAVPCLLARTGELIGELIVAPNPIRTGGFHILRRPEQLENYVRMAIERPGVDRILVLVDLDDACAVQEAQAFNNRILAMGLPDHSLVKVCFCVREYESLFLADLENLKRSAPQYDWRPGATCPNPEGVRGAKGMINSFMKKHYKEISDQRELTSKINLKNLYYNSRTYRKIVRSLSGLGYDDLSELLSD